MESTIPNIQIEITKNTPDITIKVSRGGQAFPYYDGEYNVTPMPYQAQTLATEKKILLNDIIVMEIPFSSVSNPQDGRTVYIGE